MALAPTSLYPKLIMNLIDNFKINAISHITGGGLTENLPRSIPKDLGVKIDTNSWEMPYIFKWLQENGKITNSDMYRIFNCGIGMIIIVDAEDSETISSEITKLGYKNFITGSVDEMTSKESVTFI